MMFLIASGRVRVSIAASSRLPAIARRAALSATAAVTRVTARAAPEGATCGRARVMPTTRRPDRPPPERGRPSPRGGVLPVLAFVLYVLLALAATLLLAARPGGAFPCAQDPAACDAP